jgi:hypothetical protein
MTTLKRAGLSGVGLEGEWTADRQMRPTALSDMTYALLRSPCTEYEASDREQRRSENTNNSSEDAWRRPKQRNKLPQQQQKQRVTSQPFVPMDSEHQRRLNPSQVAALLNACTADQRISASISRICRRNKP